MEVEVNMLHHITPTLNRVTTLERTKQEVECIRQTILLKQDMNQQMNIHTVSFNLYYINLKCQAPFYKSQFFIMLRFTPSCWRS